MHSREPGSRSERSRQSRATSSLTDLLSAMTDPSPPLQDRIHYPGGAWEHSHPDRIAANARMYGLKPAPVESCRVLELGCGAGGNLVPMACGLPDARFVGIELAARAVELGRSLAASLGLTNVELHQRDILDVPADLGEFDYVIAHGVYSWVPEPVRDALMSIFARHLAPEGIAYLNFNALPGGHLRNLNRDLMRFRLSVFDDPEAHGEDAMRFVRLVAGAQPHASPYRRILEEDLERIEHNPVSVLFHDDLVPAHRAFHFREVVEHASRHGLQYLCEARPADVHPGRYPGAIQAALHRFGGGRIAREQCFDFLVCQMYRCSLFCRSGIALAPIGDLDALRGLRVATSARPARAPADLTDGVVATFLAPDGASLRLDDSAAKAALEIVAERWPASVEIERLLRDARKRAGRVGRPTRLERREFGEFLVTNHVLGFVDLHTWEPPIATVIGDHPVASVLSRIEIECGARVTSLRHRQVEIDDPVAAALLERLDGSRDLAALHEYVTRTFPGESLTPDHTEAALSGLAYHCLLEDRTVDAGDRGEVRIRTRVRNDSRRATTPGIRKR